MREGAREGVEVVGQRRRVTGLRIARGYIAEASVRFKWDSDARIAERDYRD